MSRFKHNVDKLVELSLPRYICYRCKGQEPTNYGRKCNTCNNIFCDYCLVENANSEIIIEQDGGLKSKFCPCCTYEIIDKEDFFNVVKQLNPVKHKELLEEYKKYKNIEKID